MITFVKAGKVLPEYSEYYTMSTGYNGLIICYCWLGLKRVILCFIQLALKVEFTVVM